MVDAKGMVVPDAHALDAAPEGDELDKFDFLLLAALGIALPTLLLLWGWL